MGWGGRRCNFLLFFLPPCALCGSFYPCKLWCSVFLATGLCLSSEERLRYVFVLIPPTTCPSLLHVLRPPCWQNCTGIWVTSKLHHCFPSIASCLWCAIGGIPLRLSLYWHVLHWHILRTRLSNYDCRAPKLFVLSCKASENYQSWKQNKKIN